MRDAVGDEKPPEQACAVAGFRYTLFAVMWAGAALFHLAGNPRPPWVPATVGFTAVQLAVAAAAALVLFGLRRRLALVALCLLIPVSAYAEAPQVGNHWVLAAFISLAYLVAELIVRLRKPDPDEAPRLLWEAFAPAARLCVVIAYGFAAFAKLNADFFNPATSCAVFYHDELVRSWGLGALTSAGRPSLGIVIVVAAAVTELSIAVLLMVRRTQRLALLIALPFHWLLALDWSQHFWDFSAVLFAGFLLFADDAVVHELRQRLTKLRSAVRPSLRGVFATLGLLVLMVVAASTAVPSSIVLRVLGVLGSHLAWAVLGTAAVTLVGLSIARAPSSSGQKMMRPASLALLVIPALVFANGLTPYLEIKTGFGWNMYSNLRTVAGETNHFLIPATFDLTGLQRDRVAIVDSSDEALAKLAGEDYEIVYSEFREYAHDHPDEAVTYRRRGHTFVVPRIGSDPAGRGTVSAVSRRLQSFRVVDTSGTERCQSLFSPAR